MKKFRRILFLIGTGILAFSLCACAAKERKNNGITISSSEDDQVIDLGPDLTGSDFSEYRVGVSLSDCTSNTYATSYVQALNEAMADYNVNSTVFDAFGDPGQQAAQIRTLISMDVDMIILWPSNSDAAVSWVQSINEAGIPVVMANTNVSPDGEKYIEGFVGPSSVEEGFQTASRMLEDLEGKGNIVVLNGPDNYAPVQERRKGLQNASFGTRINVIEEYHNAEKRSISKTNMEDCLKKHSIGEIDAVFCYDDEAAMGAFDAMSSMNRSGEMNVYIAASGNYDIMSYVDQGLVAATSVQSPIIDAKTTVNYCLNTLLGNPLPDFYTYISTPLLTPDNVGQLKLAPWES